MPTLNPQEPPPAEPGDVEGPPRYTLPHVLAIVPKTKRSQVELLVRTGKITPAWPSRGTGHDREFDGRNLIEIAIAAELIALGFVGQRLGQFFRVITLNVLEELKAPNAEYLVVVPSSDGAAMGLPMVSGAQLEATVSVFDSCYVLNIRSILRNLLLAVDTFSKERTR